MKTVEITIKGPKSSGKTVISSIILNALIREGIKNIEFKSGKHKVDKLRRRGNLRKEFIHYFNEDENNIVIKEEKVRD